MKSYQRGLSPHLWVGASLTWCGGPSVGPVQRCHCLPHHQKAALPAPFRSLLPAVREGRRPGLCLQSGSVPVSPPWVPAGHSRGVVLPFRAHRLQGDTPTGAWNDVGGLQGNIYGDPRAGLKHAWGGHQKKCLSESLGGDWEGVARWSPHWAHHLQD